MVIITLFLVLYLQRIYISEKMMQSYPLRLEKSFFCKTRRILKIISQYNMKLLPSTDDNGFIVHAIVKANRKKPTNIYV